VGTDTLLVADYSALEVVILADLCKRLFGDEQLTKVVAPGAPDIHCENAKTVFGFYLGWRVPAGMPYAGQRVDDIPTAEFKKHPYGAVLRDMIKTVWYGLQYGKGAYGFSTLDGPDGKPIGEEVAQKMLDGIAAAVPGPFKWQRWCREYVKKNRGIYSLGGRWCPLEEETAEWAPEWLRNRGYRRAYNFPIQASAAELIGDAMIRVNADPEMTATGFRICLQVHDELVMRGPEKNVERAGERLRKHMVEATCNGTPLLIPLQASVGHGPNYYEAK
jgi:DNA polymerase-1